MNELKTGALVCKIPDKNNQYAYRPLVFITNIPHNFSDEDLKTHLDLIMFKDLIEPCDEILFRADLHSTSNEVQEEYEGLHKDSEGVPMFDYRRLFLNI